MAGKIDIQPLPPLGRLDYYQTGLLSKSSLWAFKAKLEGQKLMKAKPETLRFGQLFHEAVYEPHLYQAPDCIKTRNHVERMAAAAKKDIILAYFLKARHSRFEVPKWATINGVPVQIKMDAFNGKEIHDAKSTACASMDAFLQSCSDYGYWEQAALYKLVAGAKNMYFLGVSKSEPHRTFPVDCSKFKAEMKAAEGHILGLIEMYCELHPNYTKNALKLWKKQ